MELISFPLPRCAQSFTGQNEIGTVCSINFHRLLRWSRLIALLVLRGDETARRRVLRGDVRHQRANQLLQSLHIRVSSAFYFISDCRRMRIKDFHTKER